jgi:predicted Fe-Mo cluster-binding NifX family protein
MKIVIATNQGGLDDQVTPAFGRAPTFTVVEVADNEIGNVEVVPNQSASAPGGAGIQAAQWAANSGAQAVIAGNYGPNASGILNQAGIEMLSAAGMTVRQAVEGYTRGELTPSSGGAMAAPSFGPGMGRGMGRGGGMGRGMSGGIGRGMGRGGGMGMGRGMGQGMWGQGMTPPSFGPGPGMPSSDVPLSKEEELQMLRAQARTLEEQLSQIKRRLDELGKEEK